uniref:Uncharacterized protein n=1 Tax=Yoonia rhodophyticola TaxID=3137370 RepID=A0AAN0M9B6_9RHOB
MIRAGILTILMALPSALVAQDGSIRPLARDAAPAIVQPQTGDVFTRRWRRAEVAAPAAPVIIAQGDPAVRPLARGSVAAILAGSRLRPVARPYTRPDLAHGAQTRPLFRAEQNLFAFSPYALAISPRPTSRPATIVVAAEQRRIARLRGQVCGDPDIQGSAIGQVSGRGACGIGQGCG